MCEANKVPTNLHETTRKEFFFLFRLVKFSWIASRQDSAYFRTGRYEKLWDLVPSPASMLASKEPSEFFRYMTRLG